MLEHCEAAEEHGGVCIKIDNWFIYTHISVFQERRTYQSIKKTKRSMTGYIA